MEQMERNKMTFQAPSICPEDGVAESDSRELANFLWTVKSQFQQDPLGLAAKLAHICESLRLSGQQNKQTYKVVASALRTVVVVGNLDPHTLPGASSMEALTRDGPVFIPGFIQPERLVHLGTWSMPIGSVGAASVPASGEATFSCTGRPDNGLGDGPPFVGVGLTRAVSASQHLSQPRGQPSSCFGLKQPEAHFAVPGQGAFASIPNWSEAGPTPFSSQPASSAAYVPQQVFFPARAANPLSCSQSPKSCPLPSQRRSLGTLPVQAPSPQQPCWQDRCSKNPQTGGFQAVGTLVSSQTSQGCERPSTLPLSPHGLPLYAPTVIRSQPRGVTSSGSASSSGVLKPGAQIQSHTFPKVGAFVPHCGNLSSNVSSPGISCGPRLQQADSRTGNPLTAPPNPLPSSVPFKPQPGWQAAKDTKKRAPANKPPGTPKQIASNKSTLKKSVPTRAEPTARLEVVSPTSQESVHKQAQEVLANGGVTNVELQRVADTVKALSKTGALPILLRPEQRRQLIAQIHIIQNLKHGRGSSPATVALALENLQSLPRPQANSLGSESNRPSVSEPVVKPLASGKEKPLTKEEKRLKTLEKKREQRRMKKLETIARQQQAALAHALKKSMPAVTGSAAANSPRAATLEQQQRFVPAAQTPPTQPGCQGVPLPRLGSRQTPPSDLDDRLQKQSLDTSGFRTPSTAPDTPEPEPVDPRKPQLMSRWLAETKMRSGAEKAKWSELHTKLDQHVAAKSVELRHAELLPVQDEFRTWKVIESKKLELLPIQQGLRRQVMDDFFSPAQAELQNVRQVKVQKSLRRMREDEKKEQKLRDERARREKEKMKNFGKTLEQHKAFLADLHKTKRERMLRNNRGVTEFHKRKERAEREKRERVQREKIQALKSNDVAGYMKLVQDAKSDRVQQLLQETESYLHKLGQKLAAVTVQAREAEIGKGLAPLKAGQKGADAETIQESNDRYYTLAHAVEETVVEQPKMLAGGQLREYQMKGLQWMVSLYNNRLNGILADEMGLGKTIQVIGLLCYLKETKNVSGPFLIVVPSSVLPNWMSEIKRWAPSMVTVAYRGNPDTRRRIYGEQVAEGKFNILVTTYEFLMNKHDRPRLSKVKWAHLIIDEGHRIKNANCKLNTDLKQYTAKNRLLLTGTPIQNNLDELWTLLNFLLPDIFSSSDDFRQWFNKPFEGTGVEESEDQALLNEEENLLVINRLHQVLRPFMLRRMKEKVADELPGKVEQLIRCEASAYQRLLAKQVTEKLGRLPGQSKGKAVQNTVMELRNICNHPYLSLLHAEDVEYGLGEHFLPTAVRLCGKLEMLDRILPKLKAGGHKVLFFCTMTRLLDIMEDYLVENAYGYLRLDGATNGADRGALIDQFNAPDSPAFIFLLSLRAGGIGINLQSADTVIIYDTDWNPQVDLQAQARAHRIGQKKDVLVLRMETVNTVEEKIRARAEHKMGVATQSITAGFFDQSTSAEDRRDFLEAILREANADRQESTDVPDHEQLNKLLARTPEELDLFAAEDSRRRERDELQWRSIKGSEGVPAVPSRLLSDTDLEPVLKELEKANAEQAQSGSVGASAELGRGRRSQAAKQESYADLTERQFNYLLREGNLPPSAFGKRAAPDGKQSSGAKKQKKERKQSEEPTSRGAETPGTGEHPVESGRQNCRSVSAGHVAAVAGREELLLTGAGLQQETGPPSVEKQPEGAAALPRVEGPQTAPGAVVGTPSVVAFGIASCGQSEKPNDRSIPSCVEPAAAITAAAVEDSDEDLPICALRSPPRKKARLAAKILPLQKVPPNLPQPMEVVVTAPTEADVHRGVTEHSPIQTPGDHVSSAEPVPDGIERNKHDEASAADLLCEILADAEDASLETSIPAQRIACTPSPAGSDPQRNGECVIAGNELPRKMQLEASATVGSDPASAVVSGSTGPLGVQVRSFAAGWLLPQPPGSNPTAEPGSTIPPVSEASDPEARTDPPAELPSTGRALPVGIPESGGGLANGVIKSGEPSSQFDVEARLATQQPGPEGSEQLGQTRRKPADLGALTVDLGGDTSAAVVRTGVPQKGFKRKRALCQDAKEAFEWSEEDIEEPTKGGSGRAAESAADFAFANGGAESARCVFPGASAGCATPPVATSMTNRNSGVGRAGAAVIREASQADAPGTFEARPFSPSVTSRPEVLRVSAAAIGGPGGDEPWNSMQSEADYQCKESLHGEPTRTSMDGKSNLGGVLCLSPSGRSPLCRKQARPVSSSPTSAQFNGCLVLPVTPPARSRSESPRINASGHGTPDSVISEASLRAAQCVVGSLLESMDERADPSSKIGLQFR